MGQYDYQMAMGRCGRWNGDYERSSTGIHGLGQTWVQGAACGPKRRGVIVRCHDTAGAAHRAERMQALAMQAAMTDVQTS